MHFNTAALFPRWKRSLPERLCLLFFVCIQCSWDRFQLDVTKTGQMFASNSNESLNNKKILMGTSIWILTSVLTHCWQRGTPHISPVHHQGFYSAAVFRIFTIKLCCVSDGHPEGQLRRIELTVLLLQGSGPPGRRCTHIRILHCPCWKTLGRANSQQQPESHWTLLNNDTTVRAQEAWDDGKKKPNKNIWLRTFSIAQGVGGWKSVIDKWSRMEA